MSGNEIIAQYTQEILKKQIKGVFYIHAFCMLKIFQKKNDQRVSRYSIKLSRADSRVKM
jgi:hypothetical protein